MSIARRFADVQGMPLRFAEVRPPEFWIWTRWSSCLAASCHSPSQEDSHDCVSIYNDFVMVRAHATFAHLMFVSQKQMTQT